MITCSFLELVFEAFCVSLVVGPRHDTPALGVGPLFASTAYPLATLGLELAGLEGAVVVGSMRRSKADVLAWLLVASL